MSAGPEDIKAEVPGSPKERDGVASGHVTAKETADVPGTVPSISQKVSASTEAPAGGKKVRVPRRVLHFSDGTLEEYSTDEEEQDETDAQHDTLAQLNNVNPKSLSWLSWAWYWFRFAGYRTLAGVDTVGERLAFMLGITSPKYQYELEEYYEMKKKEEEEQKERDLESAGWTRGSAQTRDTAPRATDPAKYLAGGEPRPAVVTQAPAGHPEVRESDVSAQPSAPHTTP